LELDLSYTANPLKAFFDAPQPNVAMLMQSHTFFTIKLLFLTRLFLRGGDFVSIFDKTKKKTEDAAKKASDEMKNLGKKTEEEAKKAGQKVSGK
jgi:hypothetical protein